MKGIGVFARKGQATPHQMQVNEHDLTVLWLTDAVYATLKEEDKALQLDAIDLTKEYFKKNKPLEV